ncbi:phage protease [Yersinia enterocolitica]|uniref:phage protease n=1 Tax=Yersinia enterocolitica TaxID=630 RepID=UPI0037CCD42A
MKTRIAALAIEIAKATHHEVQLFPAGEFSAVDGRPSDTEGNTWLLNAEQATHIISQVASLSTPLVIDYEHQTLRTVNNGQPAPAAGWFSQVEWREGNGLYAIGVEWTDNAAAMIAAGEYKFISPVFLYNKRGEVTQLLHAALTNTPALDGMDAVMLAAASRLVCLSTETETTTVDEEFLAELLTSIRWMLNLPVTSSPEEIKTELQKVIDLISQGQGTAAASVGLLNLLNQRDEQIASLSANAYDPAKHAPIEVVNELQQRLVELSQHSSTAEVDSLIQAALTDGRLLPIQEHWAREYGQKDVDGFKRWLEKAPKIAALSRTQTGGNPPAQSTQPPEGLSDQMEVDVAICSLMGVNPEDVTRYAGEK